MADLRVPEEEILGENRFEDVLFTHNEATLEEAKRFADRQGDDPPYVAKRVSIESQIETQSKPYSACVFCHLSIVGSFALHKSFLEAYKSDKHIVDIDTNYTTGDLTITVNKSE